MKGLSSNVDAVTCDFEVFSDGPYECRVRILAEEEGGYSIEAVTLPGVVSQGETEAQALENFKEAFVGALETYEELGKPIPWLKAEDPVSTPEDMRNAEERWVLIHGA